MNVRILSVAALVGLTLGASSLVACEDDHDHDHDDHGGEAMPASCEAFHDLCVRASRTNPAAAECDEFTHGEGRTEAECAARKDSCLATCGGGGADAGGGDGG